MADPDRFVAPDAFLKACPSRPILARMGEKWTTLALVALQAGPLRFGALHRRLEGVSQKMLSQTLRGLERDGLVVRTVRNLRPLSVEYALAPRARSLVPIVLALKTWAETNLHDLAETNARFDEANGSAVPARADA